MFRVENFNLPKRYSVTFWRSHFDLKGQIHWVNIIYKSSLILSSQNNISLIQISSYFHFVVSPRLFMVIQIVKIVLGLIICNPTKSTVFRLFPINMSKLFWFITSAICLTTSRFLKPLLAYSVFHSTITNEFYDSNFVFHLFLPQSL